MLLLLVRLVLHLLLLLLLLHRRPRHRRRRVVPLLWGRRVRVARPERRRDPLRTVRVVRPPLLLLPVHVLVLLERRLDNVDKGALA